MNVSKIAVIVGALLAIQGVGFYAGTASKSVTALIPAFVGLPIAALGMLARKESVRKHAMHATAALAALGLLAAVGRIATAGLSFAPAGFRFSVSGTSASKTGVRERKRCPASSTGSA